MPFVVTFFAVILGVALTYLSYKTKEEIGMGDVKMLVVINCIFGLSYVLYTALFGMFIILLVVIPCLIARKMNMKTGIPFVPFYLAGTIVYYILSFAIGDASLNKAIKDGILKNAEYADYEWFSILGIYGKLKVNVYGPEKQEEDR